LDPALLFPTFADDYLAGVDSSELLVGLAVILCFAGGVVFLIAVYAGKGKSKSDRSE
jgi:hypothetical protein